MKYRIDFYDEQLRVWRPTGLSFEDRDKAVRKMDKLFFSKAKKSYRIITGKQRVVAKRLFVIEEMA